MPEDFELSDETKRAIEAAIVRIVEGMTSNIQCMTNLIAGRCCQAFLDIASKTLRETTPEPEPPAQQP